MSEEHYPRLWLIRATLMDKPVNGKEDTYGQLAYKIKVADGRGQVEYVSVREAEHEHARLCELNFEAQRVMAEKIRGLEKELEGYKKKGTVLDRIRSWF